MKPKNLETRTRAHRKRILVVDDHPLMRSGVAQLINHAPDLEVCGEAESAAQALSLVARLKPDLVLADISLAGHSGLELIKDLHVLQPNLPVLVLSMHESPAARLPGSSGWWIMAPPTAGTARRPGCRRGGPP